jgi:cytidylate kinase
MRGIVVAIDGPAASGKSTTARQVAVRLGYCHMNSGLLYRAVAWSAVRDGWIDEADRFERELKGLRLEMVRSAPDFAVRVQGEVTGPVLSDPVTARRASQVAALGPVRAKVLDVLRAAGGEGGVTCDGRDIGSVVFPKAELKVFLVASPEERAKRRILEHGGVPDGAEFADEVRRLRDRDERDSNRVIAPLLKAPDAIEIDTTTMRPSEVVDVISRLAVQRGAKSVDEGTDIA